MTGRERGRRAGRLWLLILIGMPLALMGAAWIMYQSGVGLPSGTNNKGFLIQPPLHWEGAPPGWSLVVPDRGSCGEDCRRALKLTRQIHVATGREAGRVTRLILHSGEFNPQWREDDPTLAARPGSLPKNLPGDFWIVDPQGFVALAYCLGEAYRELGCHGHVGGDALDDLRFLLRYSYEKPG